MSSEIQDEIKAIEERIPKLELKVQAQSLRNPRPGPTTLEFDELEQLRRRLKQLKDRST